MEFTKEMAEQQISWAESQWQQVKAGIWLSLSMKKKKTFYGQDGGRGRGSGLKAQKRY